MAIDFPSNPSNGSTYEYNSVLYTFKSSGSDGYWAVVGVGNYGIASSTDIDEGTNDVKYITPKGLEDSSYRTQLDANTAAIQALTDQINNL